MNQSTLEKAIYTANDFLKSCERLEKRQDKRDLINVFYGCKESGEVKRLSLELTRALAELRKST